MLNNVVNIKRRYVQMDALRVHIVEGQQVVGKLGQSLCLKKDYVNVFLSHLRRNCTVGNGFQIALDGSQG